MFKRENLKKVDRLSSGVNIYKYETNDPIKDVHAGGYFKPACDILRTHDQIFVNNLHLKDCLFVGSRSENSLFTYRLIGIE